MRTSLTREEAFLRDGGAEEEAVEFELALLGLKASRFMYE
jgi:hypothetical protein